MMPIVATNIRTALLASVLSGVLAGVAGAEPAPTVPKVLPHGGHDIAKVSSGTYTLDTNHVGVIARVSHLGFSFSVFRFDRAKAMLSWDAPAPAKSTLSASVETNSIATNVPGFAAELSGDGYLKSAAFPEASFVSTSFHRTDATHGKVDGNFTLMGKTVPVTFRATLVGAGHGFAGGPVMGDVIGAHAETKIRPQDFGLPALFDQPIEIVIDTEFDKPDAKPKS
jgi:polyisoprenoid-binding protein YceI